MRGLLFSVKVLCTLSIFAVVFHWFPVGDPMAWFWFVGCILLVGLVLWCSLFAYYRITGQQYTEKLEFYKQQHRD